MSPRIKLTVLKSALVLASLPMAGFAYGPYIPPVILMPENVTEIVDNIGEASLEVDMTTEKVTWPITQTELSVLMGKIEDLSPTPHHNDPLFDAMPTRDESYKGIKLTLKTRDGETLQPLHIFEGNVTTEGRLFQKDPGRELEYWLFGTAKIVKQQLLAIQVLPVFTFDQCKLLGNRIVETQPRQCLLPDNNLLFDIPERPTLESLTIKNFDDCLEKGKAIIHTFPRRCMAAGGAVFTEPPRLIDPPQMQLMKPVIDEKTDDVNTEEVLDFQDQI